MADKKRLVFRPDTAMIQAAYQLIPHTNLPLTFKPKADIIDSSAKALFLGCSRAAYFTHISITGARVDPWMPCPPRQAGSAPPHVWLGVNIPPTGTLSDRGRQKPDAGHQPAWEAGRKSVADGILGNCHKRHRDRVALSIPFLLNLMTLTMGATPTVVWQVLVAATAIQSESINPTAYHSTRFLYLHALGCSN